MPQFALHPPPACGGELDLGWVPPALASVPKAVASGETQTHPQEPFPPQVLLWPVE